MSKRFALRTSGCFCLLAIGGGFAAFTAVPAVGQEPVPGAAAVGQAPEQPAEQLVPPDAAAGEDVSAELLELEQLMAAPAVAPALEQLVTSVSRQVSSVGKSPTAVFVITNEMIRRSGVTTIPEALRMAPGVQVARVDSNKWAIGIRGLNARFNRNLLIQIDGRSVYTPFFAGTYWDIQDVMLQDIERIEVIRGPGATVWGENAVNGVINIITKKAGETQGTLVSAGGGTEERGFVSARYGAKVNDDLSYRIWGKGFERDTGFDTALPLEPAGDANDAWRQVRGGLRIDWAASACDHITLQGDLYDGESEGGPASRIPAPLGNVDPRFNFRQPLRDEDQYYGGNVLTRWTHEVSEESSWSLQLYYDRSVRNARLFDYALDTFDIDFQWNYPLGPDHNVIWGAGYRFHSDEFRRGVSAGVTPIEISPSARDFDIASAFIQDEITLLDDLLYFTVGTKLSINDFNNLQVQPTGRLLWTPDERQAVWGAVSRAVRTPARTTHDITFRQPGFGTGTFPTVFGNTAFDSEVLLAYELGYRAQPTDAFSWDIAWFYNDYQGLQTQEARPFVGTTFPLPFANGMDGETYGIELTANYQMSDGWRLYGAYTFMRIQLHRDPSLTFAGDPEVAEGQSPRNQVYLQSSWDIGCNTDFDLIGRYVDQLTGFGNKGNVPNYVALDARLAYRPNSSWELALVGQNLLDSSHREFHDSLIPGTEVQRGVYGMVTSKW